MANTAYYLKRSRVTIVFQIGLLLLIQCLVSVLLPAWLAVVILIILLFSWWMHSKRSTLHYFQAFSTDEWSIQSIDQAVKHMRLTRVLDHHFYIVLYFQQQSSCSYVIWYDQLTLVEWKKLKLLAKMF
ncbi:hypothetical protein ACUM6W_06950 [Acinetobacter tandoii]|jgi:predicted membrane protein|uniref:hypothetical protein n=1 Tax=Acinetobacter tandoii TaxID=202954 RepID=UPI004045A9C9